MAKKPAPAPFRKPQHKPQPKPFKPAAQSGSPEGRWLTLGLIVLAFTAACYYTSVEHGFVNWDDSSNLYENPNLLPVGKGQPWGTTISNIFDLDKGNVIGNYNPLSIFTFAVEKSLSDGEFNPILTHAVNLALHLLTVFFAMMLLWGMGIGRWGVFAGGLLFGIHPMRVESVAWATERKDVLFGMFFFWALVCYVKWLKKEDKGESRIGLYVAMIVLALLSNLSKVQAVTLPLSMLALDYWFRRLDFDWKFVLNSILLLITGGLIFLVLPRTPDREPFREKIPFWLLSIATGLANVYTLGVQGSTDDKATNYDFLDRLCIGAYSFCTYIYKAVLPTPMSPLYPYPKFIPWYIYAAPIGFFAACALVWWAWKKGYRAWVFGAAFFFVNVMFLLQIFAAGQGFLADRFTYVAYFGLFAVAAYYADIYYKKENTRTLTQVALGIVALGFGFWTVKQIGIWKDGYTLWTHVMSLDEGEKERSSLPYWNRGQYLRNNVGDYEGAVKDYTQAVKMDPTNPELLNSRGKTYFMMASLEKYGSQRKQLIEQAIKDYTDAIAKPKTTPKSKSEALANRGSAYGLMGMFEPSIRDLTEAVKLDPSNKNAYSNRSIAYFTTGQYEKALADYQEYLKLDPNDADFWYESGMVQRAMKRNPEAIKALNRAIELNPKLSIAYLERARANAQAGNRISAQQDYQKAQQMGEKLEPMDKQLMEGQ